MKCFKQTNVSSNLQALWSKLNEREVPEMLTTQIQIGKIFIYMVNRNKRPDDLLNGMWLSQTFATSGKLPMHCQPSRDLFIQLLKNPMLQRKGNTLFVSRFHMLQDRARTNESPCGLRMSGFKHVGMHSNFLYF